MTRRDIAIALFVLALTVCDALRDTMRGVWGFWPWHVCKWGFFYGTLGYITQKEWPLFVRVVCDVVRVGKFKTRLRFCPHNAIRLAVVAVLCEVAWTVTARMAGKPWGGLLGIF